MAEENGGQSGLASARRSERGEQFLAEFSRLAALDDQVGRPVEGQEVAHCRCHPGDEVLGGLDAGFKVEGFQPQDPVLPLQLRVEATDQAVVVQDW